MRTEFGDILWLFDIKHLSIKAKTTKKVKPKTLKKWHSRIRKSFDKSYDKYCKHVWVRAATTTKHTGFLHDLIVWTCLKCGCGCRTVRPEELSEPMRLSYGKDIDETT